MATVATTARMISFSGLREALFVTQPTVQHGPHAVSLALSSIVMGCSSFFLGAFLVDGCPALGLRLLVDDEVHDHGDNHDQGDAESHQRNGNAHAFPIALSEPARR